MNKKLFLNYFAIIMLFTMSAGGTFENPAIQTMIEVWPEVAATSIRLMITLPCLVSMVSMIWIGKIVGHKITYKNIILIGSLLILIGGIGPFFIHHSWNIILLQRIILGIGVGCYSIRTPLLVKSVPPLQLAKMIGLGNVLGSLVSSIISPSVGYIITHGWQYAFLSNGIILFSGLAALFFLKEPQDNEVQNTTKHIKLKLPKIIYFYIIIQFLTTLSLYPILSGMSSYLNDLNIGSATMAGYILSIYTLSGVITNLLLSKIQKFFKSYALFISLILPAIGVSLILISSNIIIIAIGVAISGIGFTTLFSMLQVYNGQVCDTYQVAQSSTLILAANQFAIFLSSYFIEVSSSLNIFNIQMRNPFLICIIIYSILAIISLYFKNRMSKL